MKQFIYIWLGITLLCVVSCYDDKGNYDYHDINEVTFGDVKTTYNVLLNIDTLKIDALVEMSSGDKTDASRFHYAWIISPINTSNQKDTISTERVLNYFISLVPNTYDLYLKIWDKKTDVHWKKKLTVIVGTPYSRGLMLAGEDKNGNVDLQMISMAGVDTVVVRNILQNSGLPALRGPIAFFHTGKQNEEYKQVWVLSETGSYYLDRETLKGSELNLFEDFCMEKYNEPMVPIVMAPEAKSADGNIDGHRVVVCSNGYLFYTGLNFISYGTFSFPLNYLQDDLNKYIPASKYIFYSIQSFDKFIWYSEETDCFYKVTSYLYPYSEKIEPKLSDAFAWDQKGTGRKLIYGENTWNEAKAWVSDGNSFALMGDGTTAFIYKFYVKNLEAKNCYQISSSVAADVLSADYYAFSSTRSVLFYVKNNTLYAYNYDIGNERVDVIPLETTDEITMLKFDLTMEPMKDALYIATYNATEGGSLRKYYVGNNPDKVELKSDPKAVWKGLTKVKNMSWRALL